MKRVFLFLGTNLAVLLVASVMFRLLGVDHYLYQRGVGIDLTAMLIFCRRVRHGRLVHLAAASRSGWR